MKIPYSDLDWEVVTDIKLIKNFAKKGLVELHYQTGTKITGLYDNHKFTCTYIDSAKTFVHDGYKYQQQYFDGCFNPYLIRTKEYPI